LLGKFDAVISMGVLEHFEDAASAVRSVARFAAPAGIILTVVPNLAGGMGALQKVLDRKAYDLHVPHDRESLAAAHAEVGLKVLESRYFMILSLGVLNADRWKTRPAGNAAFRFGSRISRTLRAAADRMPLLRPNRWTSPYIVCVARKREEGSAKGLSSSG
jgi:SAM-dependent methyltransferase